MPANPSSTVQTRPIFEADVDSILKRAGGTRAYAEGYDSTGPNADYVLANAVIELKMLDGEGLDHVSRQEKIADLFQKNQPGRPTVIIQRELLAPSDQRIFDKVLSTGVKRHVSKAAKQLKETRQDHPDTTCSVLFVINNGYTTLDHDELAALVLNRVRNDTSAIDTVVVAGFYLHSDEFDSFALWPIECFPVRLGAQFNGFDSLKRAWDEFANEFMTKFMVGEAEVSGERGPVADNVFERDGVRYIRPAPVLGMPSQFYKHGRPRRNSTGISLCPPVATSFPDLTGNQWDALNQELLDYWVLGETYSEFLKIKASAHEEGAITRPLVPIEMDLRDWESWRTKNALEATASSVFQYANEQFSSRLRDLIEQARCFDEINIIPPNYAFVETEVIGQDMANDISHISLVRESIGSDEPQVRAIVQNCALFHEHALALCGAYALREGYRTIVWSKNERFAWI